MFKKILIFLILSISLSFGSIYIYKITLPKQGKILRYEIFRGYSAPIIADGKGGKYKLMKDVPWNMFTIEEKFDWARVGGGWLSKKDIEEIRGKYEVR